MTPNCNIQHRYRVLVAACALLAFIRAPAVNALDTSLPATLQQTIDDVARKWPTVTHLGANDVANLMTDKSAVVFDVRSQEEFAVSHLDGAVWVDPSIATAAFLEQYGASVKGKTAVFYCSVGVRSSKLVARVADGLKVAGVTAMGELRGGIFAWGGEGRPLVDAKGATDKVHGYDRTWGKLVKNPQTLETKPR